MDLYAGAIAQWLSAWCNGDAAALRRLAPLVEPQLLFLIRLYLTSVSAGRILLWPRMPQWKSWLES
jgi:hypothetical protein